MIITKIKGGLGNQLFQYAMGLQLADTHNTNLFVDTSWFWEAKIPFTSTISREFDLGKFSISGQTVTMPKLLFMKKISRIKYYKEEDLSFNLGRKIPDNSYLDGYWQSSKYFNHINYRLKKEFTLCSPLNKINEKLIEEIQSSNSIMLHVRRKDYINNPEAQKVFHICGLDYYNKAIHYLTERVANIRIFVFSDDIGWCKENLKFNFPTHFVDHNKTAVEDLRLMTYCKHYIIANSTFSWWGAWLSNNPRKIVIAPRKWFKTNDLSDKDLIPSEWIRI